MKVFQNSKLQAILSCFLATNSSTDKSITNRKVHQKLHFSVPLCKLLCFRDWSIEATAMERKELLRCSLQDLFVSSPPLPLHCSGTEQLLESQIETSQRIEITNRISGSGMQHRFRFANLRRRLLTRSWRPALGAIPE